MAWGGASAGLVSLHIGVGGAILGEQAGRKGVHGGMAAWLGEAAHREMRAAAMDVCKSGGACRALAWASSWTNMEASSLHRPPVSIPSTMSRQRRLPMSSG